MAVKSETTSYPECEDTYVIHHEIFVDGKRVWHDWIMDDGTCSVTGQDMRAEINAAYKKYGLEPYYNPRYL